MQVLSVAGARAAWPILLAASLSGCSSPDELTDKDGDGVPVGDDCDDDDPDVQHEVEWYVDVDGDGFGAGELQTGCPDLRPSTNTADNADDCDDSNPSAFPGAEERYYDGIDQDCAGEDADGNGSVDDFDQDADGWEQDQDCDDTDPSLRPDPSLTETPYDGIENDCDLTTGDGDKDGDGFWSVDYAAKAPGSTLTAPDGRTGDCYDDVDAPEQEVSSHNGFEALAPADVHPDVTDDRPYDGVDADCGGSDREFDADGDGFASAAYPDRTDTVGTDCQDCTSACDGEPDWSATVASEDIHPAADETWYDGVDQDCAGVDTNGDDLNDDLDVDLDGYAATGTPDGDDCVDTNDRIHPDASDVWYDGVDTDCGGEDDYDADGDGYIGDDDFGKPTVGIAGWVQLPAGDCVDDPAHDGGTGRQDAADYNPASTDDWYDGFDHDCGGEDDYDMDADGHRLEGLTGDLSTSQQGTIIVASSDADADDCDDTDARINVGEAEVAANGIDDNCDGAAAPEGIQGLNFPAEHNSGVVVGDNFDGFGDSVVTGDLDGDGTPDVLLGFDTNSGVGTYAGAAAVYSGSDLLGSSLDEDEYFALVEGSTEFNQLGRAVAAEDVDGDGLDDLIITEPYHSNSDYTDGAAWVFYGPLSGSTSAPWTGTTESADLLLEGTSAGFLGQSVGAFDEDQDGVAELVVTAPYFEPAGSGLSSSGAVYFLDAETSGTYVDTDAHVVYGSGSGEYLGVGKELSGGDFDGNGYPEVALGSHYSARGAAAGGTTYLVETPLTGDATAEDIALVELNGNTDDQCGFDLALGDLDADGYDDLVVGCFEYDSAQGAVAVLYGSAGPSTTSADPTTADALIVGSSPAQFEQLGYQVEVGDITGDGTVDLIAGGPYYSPSGTAPFNGRVQLFVGGSRLSGSYTSTDADGIVEGDEISGGLGFALDASHDLDGDGTVDLLVTRIGTNILGGSGGDVLLFTGGEW